MRYRKALTTALTAAAITMACPGVAAASSQSGTIAGFTSWNQVLAQAKGETVNFYMWSGSTYYNNFVSKLVADAAKPYGITVRRVPISDTTDALDTVLAEKEAHDNANGRVDLAWVNGDNFLTGVQGKLWYCGYDKLLPNNRLINWNDPAINEDFGTPVNYCEMPWGEAQFAMIYNKALVPTPPAGGMKGLVAWIKAHPGEFTYTAPPDFTGEVFLRQMLYYTNGGYKDLLGPFSKVKYNQVTPKLWKVLNSLKPYLWDGGSTYPTSISQLDSMFGSGGVAFDMTYGPGGVGGEVKSGTFPPTTREYVFPSGMIGNTNYTAIPYNSPHKAAAMVVQNLLLSPELQYELYLPSLGLGEYPAIVVSRAGAQWVKKINSVKLPPSVAPPNVIRKNSQPELNSTWDTAIANGWKLNVEEK